MHSWNKSFLAYTCQQSSDEPKVGSQYSYRSTSESDQSNTPDTLPSNTNDESDTASVMGRPRHAIQTSRDAMMNRIQVSGCYGHQGKRFADMK
jgi:hypothetical protein